MAGVGTGVYQSFADAVQRTVHIQRTHIPDMKRHTVYRDYYQLYLELYQRLADSYEKLDMIVNSAN